MITGKAFFAVGKDETSLDLGYQATAAKGAEHGYVNLEKDRSIQVHVLDEIKTLPSCRELCMRP